MVKVFLGGTTKGYDWRGVIEREFEHHDGIELFNPIVKDWNDEAINIENEYKKTCDVCLYLITPHLEGIYSIAEAVDDSNKRPEKTVFVYVDDTKHRGGKYTFTKCMKKSLEVTKQMIVSNGAKSFDSLEELIGYLKSLI